MWERCLAELRYEATSFHQTSIAVPIDTDCKVVGSDRTNPWNLAQDFIRVVAHLKDIPAQSKDWHPGTDRKVLDLVHPSLFPLV